MVHQTKEASFIHNFLSRVLFGRELHIHFPLLMQYLNNINVNMEISMIFFWKK
jgi:hypothetical protein